MQGLSHHNQAFLAGEDYLFRISTQLTHTSLSIAAGINSSFKTDAPPQVVENSALRLLRALWLRELLRLCIRGLYEAMDSNKTKTLESPTPIPSS